MGDRFICACDFDGTITTGPYPALGPPRAQVLAHLRKRRAEGAEIVLHTCRVNSHWEDGTPESRARTHDKLVEMLHYLDEHEVPYDRIWGVRLGKRPELWQREWRDVGKPFAHEYIDDLALRPEALEEDAR